MFITFDVNWLAIAVSMLINMVIGSLWYGPFFGKRWAKELGFRMDEVDRGQMWMPYLIAILNSFVMAFAMANVMAWLDISSLVEGLILGAAMWVGFTGFTFAANHAYEGRSFTLWVINSGTYLFSLVFMGGLLAIWH